MDYLPHKFGPKKWILHGFDTDDFIGFTNHRSREQISDVGKHFGRFIHVDQLIGRLSFSIFGSAPITRTRNVGTQIG